MKGRAVAIYEDNGESVCVELPTEQALMDEIYEVKRDAGIKIRDLETEIEQLKQLNFRANVGMWAAIMLAGALLAALLAVVL